MWTTKIETLGQEGKIDNKWLHAILVQQALFQEPKNFTYVNELTSPKASIIIIIVSILQIKDWGLERYKSLAHRH